MGDKQARRQKKREQAKLKKIARQEIRQERDQLDRRLVRQELCDELKFQLGFFVCLFRYLTQMEQTFLQLMSLYFYRIGVPRVQRRFSFEIILFPNKDSILALQYPSNNVTELKTDFDSKMYHSIRVEQNIFQIRALSDQCRMLENLGYSKFRVIEKATMYRLKQMASYCNMADQFIFATGGQVVSPFNDVERYDIASDSWERLPGLKVDRAQHGSCTIGTSVYVFCGVGFEVPRLNSVERLETRDLEAGWHLIEIALTSLNPRAFPVVAALNASQILIMGGYPLEDKAAALTFDTINYSIQPVAQEAPFKFYSSMITGSKTEKIRPGVVIALVAHGQQKQSLIEYSNGSVRCLYMTKE